MKPGRLLLLPTPIGAGPIENVLPAGVIDAARNTRHFLAERAKTARAFLKAVGHPGPLRELQITEIGHDPDPAKFAGWMQPAFDGHDVALVAEAGCPAVADPGAGLVRYAHEHAISVRPLVGPSALLLALMASGLNGQQFRFVGYLPQDRDALTQALIALEADARNGTTQLCIETPYRNERLFETLLRECAADTQLTVASALTADTEAVATRTVEEWRRLDPSRRPVLRDRPTVFALLAARRATVRKTR